MNDYEPVATTPAEAALPVSGFRKPRRSFANGNCVDVGSRSGIVAVRDTANRGGPVLAFPSEAWAAFTGKTARSKP